MDSPSHSFLDSAGTGRRFAGSSPREPLIPQRLVPCVVGLLGVLAWCAPARCQTNLYDLAGPFSGAVWGTSIAVAGDVDQDGRDDILVGTSTADPSGAQGTVKLYSGLDQHVIWTWTGSSTTTSSLGTVVIAAGDLNADGVPDLLATAPLATPTGPRALVYSGADASLIRSFIAPPGLTSFGKSAAKLSDTNGDGVQDFAVGAPNWITNGTDTGRVYVFSGATGAQRYLLDGAAAQDLFGTSILGVGDFDGDGVGDFAVGATQRNASPAKPGYVDIRSGATGGLIRRILGLPTEKWFGCSLALLDDLDGDGKGDLAVGAPLSVSNGVTVGVVAVVSPATGLRIATVPGTEVDSQFGYSVSSAGDVDRDGHADLLVGVPLDSIPLSHGGALVVVCTRDSRTILELNATSANQALGTSVASGDVNRDGSPDVLGGAPYIGNGRVRVLSTVPVPPHAYCVGAPNSQTFGALLGWTGTTSLSNNDLTITITDAIADGPGMLYYGSASAQVPFGSGYRCVGGSFVRLAPILFANSVGAATFPVDWTAAPFTQSAFPPAPGALLFFQYWYRDVAGVGATFNLSNALAVTLAP